MFSAILRWRNFTAALVLARPSQFLLLGVCSLLVSRPALAQLIPDATAGTQIQPEAEVRGLPSDVVEGGIIRNDILFHSFQDFNIEAGRGVYFANPADISNILSRVTGSNGSNIDGTLGVLGNANFFLINPNGIVFGPNARLDVAGAFTASTTDAFRFADGQEFSATDPQAPPLLRLNITPGLQLGLPDQGDIKNAGNLAVAAGQPLTLQGRNVRHTGSLTAPGGWVGLFGQTVGLLDNAQIDVSGFAGGGTVLIGGTVQGANPDLNALRTYIGPDVRIQADALRVGDGGVVVVWSEEATGFYGNISARGAVDSLTSPSNSGEQDLASGGFVEVSSQGHLIFRGAVDTATPAGQPGILLLDPTTITLANGTADGTADGTDTFAGEASGLAGQVLSGPISAIDDLGPTTIYESELEGLSGDTDVVLQATDGITVEDLADNELLFARGAGRITFVADANGDGVGDVVMMDLQDNLATNGRDLAISGVNLNLGIIDSSIHPLNISPTGSGGSVDLSAAGDVSVDAVLTMGTFSDGGNAGTGGDISLTAGGNIATSE
nr:filamentous hemagglutinin N-terminal domain-containing protein [Leptolyngbyaceae cyanobacterium MO_188.B28]